MEDAILLQAIKAGHPDAFKQLVEQHQHHVLNTCYGFVRNQEDAEDLAQDVFLEVSQAIAGFRADAALSTWMYRIAVTKSLDFLRKQQRQKRFGRLRQILGLDDPVAQIPAPPSANPQTTLENQERARILHEAIASLAENQRIAVTLNKSEGFSYQEIAAIMGISVSAVEALLHRAKNNLQKKLAHYYEQHLR